jgi:hypothetical protein
MKFRRVGEKCVGGNTPIEKRFLLAAAIVIGLYVAFLSTLQVRRLTER